MPRKYLADGEPQERDKEGHFLPIPEDKKLAVIKGLGHALLTGETLESYAGKHEVSVRTLKYWCAQLGDEYKDIRRQWLDAKLVDAEQMMVDASDPFKLAKGRELFRAAIFYAERRDPERYADKREITHKTDDPTTPEQVRDKITQLEAKLGIRVIEHEKQTA